MIIHFHLRHPIMIGKKKTADVQFYIETMDASESLDNTRRSGYDPDELEEEQRQRALRNRYNQEFHNFTKKIEEAAKNLEFDIPYRELGFYGQPNKSINLMMPCVNALVELTEVRAPPPSPDAARPRPALPPLPRLESPHPPLPSLSRSRRGSSCRSPTSRSRTSSAWCTASRTSTSCSC